MKTIVITGASDGIGAAAAKELVTLDHQVVIVGRNPEKTAKIATELGMPYHLADFTKLADVERLAVELRQYDHIDVLANNAGGIMGDRTLTADGFEKTFQVNHLAGFLLTNLLLDKLLADHATVIQTSSIAANLFVKTFDVNDVNVAHEYTSEKAYGYAKYENILFTRELQRRYDDQLTAVAFHPGVVRTSFSSESNTFMRWLYRTPLKYLGTISPERSAKRLVNLALGVPGADFIAGEVYDGKKLLPVKVVDDGNANARQLWEESAKMVAQFTSI
ncbi:SDR family NAD(P)-dependent oxidoreductase [Weissella confusa]